MIWAIRMKIGDHLSRNLNLSSKNFIFGFPFLSHLKPGGAVFGRRPKRSRRGKSGGAGFSQRPRKAGGEVRRCRVWPTLTEIPGEYLKQLKSFRFQLFQILSYRSLRGLAPEPPVSLATPRGQGSPLRFDTQPTGWSVGSAARHQGGIRKDCSAALLNLYKASPLTPFRFPPKPNSAGFSSRPRRAGGESQAVQGLASVPGERAGKIRRCRVWPTSPESGRGKSGGAGSGQRPRRAGRENQAVQVLASVPGERAGKVRRCRVWPASPEERAGKSGGAGFGQH